MPPKFKFTKDEIIDACFSIARKKGLKCVTARGVAAELNSSSKVIFSLFEDMEDLKNALIIRIKEHYKTYVDEGIKNPLPFKGVGECYIKFAKEEPKLFQILFMQETEKEESFQGAMHLDDSYDRILKCVESSYGLNTKDAEELYKCLWVSTHGIAVLIATGVCNFTADDIQSVLSKTLKGVLSELKKNN